MADPLVLVLDGSTRVCSAALLRLVTRPAVGLGRTARLTVCGWEVAARRAVTDGRGQAKVLLLLVDEMLQEVGEGPGSFGAIVVGTGPGTFTGVRITVATARALGLALSVPVLGVSTLGALAAGAAVGLVGGAAVGATSATGAGASAWATAEGAGAAAVELLAPVADARRGQVFFGLYERDRKPPQEGAAWVRSAEFGACDRQAFGEMLAGHASREALVVADDRELVGELPPGVVFNAAGVQAERLVLGQELLDEPGVMPQGSRLGPWLLEALAPALPQARWDPATGSGPGLVAVADPTSRRGQAEAGSPGTPESVKPIYVRSPDADIHITKMKDPWADGLEQR